MKSDIYIAKDYNDIVLSIVCAKTRELALAYWQGKDIFPHKTVSLKEHYEALENHPTGIIPIFNTIEISGYDIGRDKTYRIQE